jgi:hypothetical protein
MRQGQHNHNHNKRSRGRGRGGRPGGGGGGQGGNPINRVYESNGPDVKVRGTAQTIAEKYMQLARDAQSVGDTVMAESYYQHAEHYLRILAAAQAYNQQHMAQQQQFRRPFGNEDAQEQYEETGESEPPAEAETSSIESPVIQTPEPPVAESDARQQPRRQPDDRPRQHFERQRNGGDQTRQQPRVEDAADGWDGPQPQFLRRPQGGQGQPNGGDRQQQRDRRPMRERGAQRGRDEQAASAEGSDAQAGPGDSDPAAG